MMSVRGRFDLLTSFLNFTAGSKKIINIKANMKSKISSRNDPTQSVSKISFPIAAISVPRKAEIKPPRRTTAVAEGLCSRVTLSIAAKRNCIIVATVAPRQKLAKLNRKNISFEMEKIQRPISKIEYMHELKNTFFRPKIDIRRITGMTLRAVPTTIVATGSVDKLFVGESSLPIIPATKTIKTLSDINKD